MKYGRMISAALLLGTLSFGNEAFADIGKVYKAPDIKKSTGKAATTKEDKAPAAAKIGKAEAMQIADKYATEFEKAASLQAAKKIADTKNKQYVKDHPNTYISLYDEQGVFISTHVKGDTTGKAVPSEISKFCKSGNPGVANYKWDGKDKHAYVRRVSNNSGFGGCIGVGWVD